MLLLFCFNNGRIDGRTVVQKLMYFAQLLVPMSKKLHFGPHYYGPYSAELAAMLDNLVALRFLRTEIRRTAREREMYSYFLTDDGRAIASKIADKKKDSKRIRAVVEKCKSLSGLNPDTLSFAAKANHILSQKKQTYTRSQVIAEGKSFGWRLTPGQVNSGVNVLLDLGLAKRKKSVK